MVQKQQQTNRPRLRHLVHIRNFNFKRRREFRRQEFHRYVRLQGANWRKPRGMHSKLRLSLGNRQLVRVGFGTDRRVRGLSRSGNRMVYIQGRNDCMQLMPRDIAIVSRRIGRRLRMQITEEVTQRGAVIEK